jgi:hypothetical protein
MTLCVFNALANGFRNFRGFAETNPDLAFFVSDDHQRGEPEVLTALNNLRNTVDRNQTLFEFAGLFFESPVVLHVRSSLEVQPVQKGSGRLLTSPDIISRGFIYLRDSEELMGTIRQYLKQKVARTFVGRKIDLDVAKKEIKDEITRILYDQTRRTPIVIPVINEVGGGSNIHPSSSSNESSVNNYAQQGRNPRHQQSQQPNYAHDNQGQPEPNYQRPAPKTFPAPVVPDIETIEPHFRSENRSY